MIVLLVSCTFVVDEELADQLDNAAVLPGSVSTVSIVDGAVTEDKLDANSVSNQQLQDECVTSEEIADGTIATVDIADDAVTESGLARDSVGSSELQDDCIDGDNVRDESLTGDDIDDGSITDDDLATGSVGTSVIADGSIYSNDLDDGSVGSDALADSVGFGEGGSTDGAIYLYSSVGSNASLKLYNSYDSDGTAYDLGAMVSYYATSSSSFPYVAFAMFPDTNENGLALGVARYGVTTSTSASTNPTSSFQVGFKLNSEGTYDVYADGDKTFVIPHPEEPTKRIVYAAIEGPESAAYVRGTARIDGGIAVVELPDHFRLVASPEGITASVTPASADSLGLAVTELTPEYLVIEELYGGAGSYDVYWQVNAKRAGREDFRVIRDASEYAPAPEQLVP